MVGVAQLVEYRIVIPVVAGSIPVAHPIQNSRSNKPYCVVKPFYRYETQIISFFLY